MIILPAILESFRSLKDRSYKIVFETNELSPEQTAGISTALMQAGFLAFKSDEFKQAEKEMIDKLETDFEDQKKTPGQRLRAVLYVAWSQRGEGFETFTQYYDSKMDKFINFIKEKLD